METSDSENFESADEDFQSDEENTQSVCSIINRQSDSDQRQHQSISIPSNNSEILETKLNTLDLKDKSKTTESRQDNDNTVFSALASLDNDNVLNTITTTKLKEVPIKDKSLNYAQDHTLVDVKSKIISKETPKITSEDDGKLMDSNAKNKNKKLAVKKQAPPVPFEVKQSEQQNSNDDDANLWEQDEINWNENKHHIPPENEQQSNNMWDLGEEDGWTDIESSTTPATTESQHTDFNNAWTSWGNWDVSTILTTATQSVSTLTNQVSYGLNTVLETGIGIPESEELARIQNKQQAASTAAPNNTSNTNNLGFVGLGQLVSSVSKLVETTGSKVISGGLDTLETIGKKTMEVLQEGDPGLKKKRAFLKIHNHNNDRPVLSQLLREAKQKSEEIQQTAAAKRFVKNYESLFDDHQGLVHLEALEMLSKQCDIKLETMLESDNNDHAMVVEMQETLDQVKELCELPDEDDDDEQISTDDIQSRLETAVLEINIPITYQKLIRTWHDTELWLNDLKLEQCDAQELHQQAIEALAQLTAIAVEQFHKTGELLLIKEHRSTADEADSLVQLTTTLTSLIGIVAAKFSDKLNAKGISSTDKENINGLITNVFFEAANSSSYIQDAFQLLIPVLQVGAV